MEKQAKREDDHVGEKDNHKRHKNDDQRLSTSLPPGKERLTPESYA